MPKVCRQYLVVGTCAVTAVGSSDAATTGTGSGQAAADLGVAVARTAPEPPGGAAVAASRQATPPTSSRCIERVTGRTRLSRSSGSDDASTVRADCQGPGRRSLANQCVA